MRKLAYLTSARDDLARIFQTVAEESGSARIALRLTERIREKCVTLADLPGELGRARPELLADLRSVDFGDYLIFFRYAAAQVEIVAIVERAQDFDAATTSDPP